MPALASPPPVALFCDPSIDEDLARRVRLFLDTLHLPALRRIQIEAEHGVVVAEGVVRSFYERQLALACVRRVAGVRRIVDSIRVLDSQ